MSNKSTSGLFSTRPQRILIYGLVIFGIVPIALGLLLWLTQSSGVAAGFLTAYFVIAILGLAVIAFEQLAHEIRKTPRPST